MHTFNTNVLPVYAPIFPTPQWLSFFLLPPHVKHETIQVGVGIVPYVQARMKELQATEWFANWSGKIKPNTLVSITYR